MNSINLAAARNTHAPRYELERSHRRKRTDFEAINRAQKGNNRPLPKQEPETEKPQITLEQQLAEQWGIVQFEDPEDLILGERHNAVGVYTAQGKEVFPAIQTALQALIELEDIKEFTVESYRGGFRAAVISREGTIVQIEHARKKDMYAIARYMPDMEGPAALAAAKLEEDRPTRRMEVIDFTPQSTNGQQYMPFPNLKRIVDAGWKDGSTTFDRGIRIYDEHMLVRTKRQGINRIPDLGHRYTGRDPERAAAYLEAQFTREFATSFPNEKERETIKDNKEAQFTILFKGNYIQEGVDAQLAREAIAGYQRGVVRGLTEVLQSVRHPTRQYRVNQVTHDQPSRLDSDEWFDKVYIPVMDGYKAPGLPEDATLSQRIEARYNEVIAQKQEK